MAAVMPDLKLPKQNCADSGTYKSDTEIVYEPSFFLFEIIIINHIWI